MFVVLPIHIETNPMTIASLSRDQGKTARTDLRSRFRPEMDPENSADHVFVDIDAESQGDLVGNALAAPGAIAPFHLQRPRRSALWSGLWDLAGGPVRVKTAVGTFAWSAFYENAAKLKA